MCVVTLNNLKSCPPYAKAAIRIYFRARNASVVATPANETRAAAMRKARITKLRRNIAELKQLDSALLPRDSDVEVWMQRWEVNMELELAYYKLKQLGVV